MTSLWRTVLFYASAILVGAVLGYALHGKPAPAPSVKVAQQAGRAAHAVAAKIDTVYQTQRAVEQHTRVQYDTTTDTVVVVRDTGRVVYVEKAVADREIRACTEVLNTCDARHAADSVEKARLHDEIAARDAAKPSRLHTLLVDVSIAGIAYEAGRHNLGSRLSVVLPFGVRF